MRLEDAAVFVAPGLLVLPGCSGSAKDEATTPAPTGSTTPVSTATSTTTTSSTPASTTTGTTPTRPAKDCPDLSSPPTLSKDAPWIDVAVSNGTGCALSREGLLTCFGEGSEELNAQLPKEPVVDFDVTGGVLGYAQVCMAMASDGRVECRHSDPTRHPPEPPELRDVVQISGESTSWIVLTATSEVHCWDGWDVLGLEPDSFCSAKVPTIVDVDVRDSAVGGFGYGLATTDTCISSMPWTSGRPTSRLPRPRWRKASSATRSGAPCCLRAMRC